MTDKKTVLKHSVRFLSFSIILAAVITLIATFLFIPIDSHSTSYGLFYKEKKNSLDVVMVGSSTVRDGYSPMEAYKHTGLTSHNIVSSPTHLEVIEIVIDEIARTQKPKVVYIDLNGLNNQTKNNQQTFVKDYFASLPDDEETRKVKDKLLKKYTYLHEDKTWEPFKGHNSFRQQIYWESLVYNKQFATKGYYPNKAVKEAKVYDIDPIKTLPLSEDGKIYLDEILAICKKHPDIKFLFGQMPRYLSSKIASFDAYQTHSPRDAMYIVRSAKPKVEEAGYTFLDFSSNEFLAETLKLDPKKDQYDAEHLNHRGAKKFTDWFSDYLLKNYFNGIKPEHDKDVEEEFTNTYKKYEEVVKPIEKKLGMKEE